MTLSARPPMVSTPSESGMTSSSSQSSPEALLPASTLAWIAAPSATTLSGSRLLSGVWPKSSATACCTWGMRVAPPTITTPFTSPRSSPASRSALREGPSVFATRGRVMSWNSFCATLRSTVSPLASVAGGERCEPCALHDPAEEALVEIVAAERGVAVCRHHLEHALRELQDRDVESAAAQIVDGVDALGGIVEPVGDRRRGRFVQEPQHVQAGEPAGVLGGLALRVVEVRRDRDDSAGELPA